MTSRSAQTRSSLRVFAFTAFVILAFAFGSRPASASEGAPAFDDGASGGASFVEETESMMLEQLGLVATAGPDSPEVLDPNPVDWPVLVGSGYDHDREIVANANEVPVLVGSNADREIVADAEETPVLVGSNADREIVASVEEIPVLVGSDADREIVASSQATAGGTLDETERSIALIDLTGGTTASSGTLDESARSIALAELSADSTIAQSGTLLE